LGLDIWVRENLAHAPYYCCWQYFLTKFALLKAIRTLRVLKRPIGVKVLFEVLLIRFSAREKNLLVEDQTESKN